MYFRDDLIGLFDSPLDSNTTESHSLGFSLMDSNVLASGEPSSQAPAPSLTPSSTAMSITHGHPVVPGWDKQVSRSIVYIC